MAKLINILLRKTDPDFPWGFTLGVVPPALHTVQITSVDAGSLASEHLEPGDRVLELEGIDTTLLSVSDVETLLTNPSNKLELLIMKKTKPGQKLFSEPSGATTRTVKTKETVSSTSEEKEETKISNQNLEKSKIITSEGETHKQVTETTESTEHQRTDTFWTCAPSDLVTTDKRKGSNVEGAASKNQSDGNYMSESSIFKNLNNYRDEGRKLDPREEKRRFWESCRKGDHVRRFKWGDSLKPNRVSPTGRSEGSTESLYSKSPSQPVYIPKMERSKSCEPSDCQSVSNPFFQFKTTAGVSPTNPFFREFERVDNSQSSEIFSSSLDEQKLKSLQKPVPQKFEESPFICESTTNDLSSGKFYNDESLKYYTDFTENSQTVDSYEHFARDMKKTEETSNNDVKERSDNWSPQVDSHMTTNVVSKKEFETKCKYFENVCSVPNASVNANARDIVEERLLDRGSSMNSPTTTSPLWTESKNSYQKESNLETHSQLHPLKKPSDFINQKMKTVDSAINQNKSEETKFIGEMETGEYQKTINSKENNSTLESTKYYIGRISEDTTNYSENRYTIEENPNVTTKNYSDLNDFYRFRTLHDQKFLNNKNQGCVSDHNPELAATYTMNNTKQSTQNTKTEHKKTGSEKCMSHSDTFDAGLNSTSKTYTLNEQMSTHRGGSLERDFYEGKFFKESNYRKVTKGSQSPYENMMSASSKEYQEESRPFIDSEKRSKTPAEFYDNFEDSIKQARAKSPIDISFKTFRDIQTRLGKLLGGKPITIENFKYHTERTGQDSVEEAFQKLAIQEGIVDSTTPDESYSRQSNQIGGHGGSGSPGTNSVDGPPPPPPPLPGGIPSQKLSSNIPPMRKGYEPPAAIQNAMMTKDKKPFTYTPGGLDLAEIRSPRMAKRINRNAHLEDSCTPQQQRPQQSGPPPSLPPSALAAMQPQIAIPVFPPGGSFPSQLTPPPPPPPPVATFSVTNNATEPDFPPPPPLPNVVVPSPNSSPPSGAIPPPPPPPPPAATPTSCKSTTSSPQDETASSPQSNGFSRGQPLAFLQDIHNRPQLRSVGPINQNKLPNDFVAEIPVHPPLRNVQHPPRSSYDPKEAQSQIPIQLKSVGPKPPSSITPAPPFIPQPMSPETQPIFLQSETQQTAPPHHPISPPVTHVPTVPNLIHNPPTPTTPVTHAPSTNRAPAPWMTTRQVSRDAPPPWTSKQDVTEEQQQQPPPLMQHNVNGSAPTITRVIPIQIEGKEVPSPQPQMPPQVQLPPQQNPYYAMQTPQLYVAPQQRQPFPHHLQYVQPPPSPYYQEQCPSPLQQQPSNSQPFNQSVIPPVQTQGRTHIIPIRVEGMSDETQTQSPLSFAQRSNSSDTQDGARRPLQTQTSWTGAPTQSRSFRVLQKITGSEDEPAGPFPAPTSETFLVNRVLPQQQAASPAGADISKTWNPNVPLPNYPPPDYWYYPPQTLEEQQQFWEHYNAMCAYMAQMNAAAYRYSPYPMYPYPYLYVSDNEEYSGYSSSDEMTYYGQMFKKRAQNSEQIGKSVKAENITPNETTPTNAIDRNTSGSSIDSDKTEKCSNADTISETDTEIEEEEVQMNALQSIKSVPNIHVFNDGDSNSEESEESDDESCRSSDHSIPHQLSVIYEESEQSDIESSKKTDLPLNKLEPITPAIEKKRVPVEEECHDPNNATVTVRLPLQFKFTRSSDDEEVATVIVGNSEVESESKSSVPSHDNLIITEIVREGSDPDVTATIRLNKFRKPSTGEAVEASLDIMETSSSQHNTGSPNSHASSDSNSPVDFWKELSDKDMELPKLNDRVHNETPSQTSEDDSKHDESDCHSSGTSIQTIKKGLSGSENISSSETETPCSHLNGKLVALKDENEEIEAEESEGESETYSEDESDETTKSSSEEDDSKMSEGRNDSTKLEYLSVKENEKALEEVGEVVEDEYESDGTESEEGSSESSSEEEEEDRYKEISNTEPVHILKKLQTHKSQEESEEDDSGVTSDLSRHISETDTDPECGGDWRKMTRYQRANTHSRLFKLLQDECKVDESPEEEQPLPLATRKERLTLPLNNFCSGEQESLSSSSGINSPSSPTTTDKLVKGLVKSLLSRKKGRHFRKLPLEKLHAAALRILQEDMDVYDTASTSDESNIFLSPIANRGIVQKADSGLNAEIEVPNPEAYGGNYYDYCKYYSTWGNPDMNGLPNDLPDEYEIIPSKAFRILQENTIAEQSSPNTRIAVSVRCPRVSPQQPFQNLNPNPEINAKLSESASSGQET